MKTEEDKALEAADYIDAELEPAGDVGIVTTGGQRTEIKGQRSALIYLVLPLIFLVVTLLGGLRLGAVDNAFVFLKPALVCLVFASLILVLYFRAGLIAIEGWFSDELSALQNVANVFVLLTLFTATV